MQPPTFILGSLHMIMKTLRYIGTLRVCILTPQLKQPFKIEERVILQFSFDSPLLHDVDDREEEIQIITQLLRLLPASFNRSRIDCWTNGF
jgi:hypothetical protein